MLGETLGHVSERVSIQVEEPGEAAFRDWTSQDGLGGTLCGLPQKIQTARATGRYPLQRDTS